MKGILISIIIFVNLFSCSSHTKNDVNATVYSLDNGIALLADNLLINYDNQGIKRVAIIPFKENKNTFNGIGKYIADSIQNKLYNNKQLILLERQHIDSIIDENKLSFTGITENNEYLKYGSLLGADLLCIGVVDKINFIKITAKIVEVSSGRIISISEVFIDGFQQDNEMVTKKKINDYPTSYQENGLKQNGNNLEDNKTIIYITKTGNKYHRVSCSYLKNSRYTMALSKAKELGYQPCSVCKPPL